MKTKDLLDQIERFLVEEREHSTLYRNSLLRTGHDIQAKLRLQEESLNRRFGSLEPCILRISTTSFTIAGKHINPWRSAFMPGPQIIKGQSLDIVISDLNRIIGHYERSGQDEIPLEDVNILFDSLKLHSRVANVSERLFKDGHYAQAILDAFKEVNVAVQEISKINHLDGKKLMDEAFSLNNPKINLTNLQGQTERDEQLGFMLLFGGASIGIRNPKAHSNIKQDDPYKTLHYLSLASLLLKRLDERVAP